MVIETDRLKKLDEHQMTLNNSFSL